MRGPVYPVSSLDGIIGQAPAKVCLLGAMKAERVHHAWIFHGPQGVGKFTTAIAFAATLLDPTTHAGRDDVVRPEPGGAVQELVRAGNHPDLHVITKELASISREDDVRKSKQITLPVNVVREFLIDPALKTRVLGHESPTRAGKVFIVDEAELMAAPAQNAVLKLLEEPPEGTVLILLTSSEERLLPTIRSRGQRVAFGALNQSEMEKWFAAYPKSAGLAAAQRDWVLRFAAGSPGAAALAIEHELYAWHQKLGPLLDELAKGGFPPELAPAMGKFISERAEAVVEANPAASKDSANKAWARRMLGYVSEDARSRLRQLASKSGAGGGLREDIRATRLLQLIDRVNDAERELGSNVNMAFVLENLVAQAALEPGLA